MRSAVHGGMAPREALWRYTGAIPVMSGSGATTPGSAGRQVELIKAWKINVILGFPAYLRHMALVARDEMGIDVRTLGIRLIGTHLGREDRRQIEQPALERCSSQKAILIAAQEAANRTDAEAALHD